MVAQYLEAGGEGHRQDHAHHPPYVSPEKQAHDDRQGVEIDPLPHHLGRDVVPLDVLDDDEGGSDEDDPGQGIVLHEGHYEGRKEADGRPDVGDEVEDTGEGAPYIRVVDAEEEEADGHRDGEARVDRAADDDIVADALADGIHYLPGLLLLRLPPGLDQLLPETPRVGQEEDEYEYDEDEMGEDGEDREDAGHQAGEEGAEDVGRLRPPRRRRGIAGQEGGEFVGYTLVGRLGPDYVRRKRLLVLRELLGEAGQLPRDDKRGNEAENEHAEDDYPHGRRIGYFQPVQEPDHRVEDEGEKYCKGKGYKYRLGDLQHGEHDDHAQEKKKVGENVCFLLRRIHHAPSTGFAHHSFPRARPGRRVSPLFYSSGASLFS